MCTRTVSTLARALEASGIATVCLISNRRQAERIGPPRGLYCEFPLGRPLGRPLDAAYQHRVLEAAFGLLPRRDGPLLVDFGEVIEDEADTPLACPIPPRLDPNEPPAVAEARALRPAFERGLARVARPQVGRVVDADGIPEAIRPFVAVADGAAWNGVAYAGGEPTRVLMDIRAYYETAALGLSDHVPAARASESWYHRTTRMGELLERYFRAVQAADPPFPGLFYVMPLSQTTAELF
jgi:D-proline reductase (dithiol) PrdB